MGMNIEDTLKLIDTLREKGAVRICVGGIEVEFAAALSTAPPSKPVRELSPEEKQRADDDLLNYSASPVGF